MNLSHETNDLKAMESRIHNKMAESVEELASIIKEYAKRQKKVGDRLNEIETKVFGHTKKAGRVS